jgi:hypothetical protein
MEADMSVSGLAAAPGRRLYDAAFFVALLATALAHVLELPNKIDLPREQYFIVQGIYRGWWQIAFVLAVQAVSLIAVLVMSRGQTLVFRLTLLAVLSLAAAQAVFWTWTQPANAVTENWTVAPHNWEVLRLQWELSHLAGAIFQLIAFGCLVAAVLARRSAAEIAPGGDGPP